LLPQDVIRKKRDGLALAGSEIRSFVNGATSGVVSEGQIGAFAMAVYLRGMTIEETADFTLAMRDSGKVLDWKSAAVDQARLIDKHSSGGVGDEKITLLVVPLAAACGVYVPNLSGRGLDYCAGEVDMLDAVPGYDTALPPDMFMRAVEEVGGAIIGPTFDLAPADRKIFYVRDVTATVESVPLITGSILSKKLASSPRGLVITVGSGAGAYMKTLDDARRLARSMAEVAARVGVPSVMLLTDLSSVLGTSVGNAVAVQETVDFLLGRHRDARVLDLVLAIVAEMVALAGIEPDPARARSLGAAKLEDGSAANRFGRMVGALGGPGDFVERAKDYLPTASVVRPVPAETAGFVVGMDAGAIGHALVELGGGRKHPDEKIDLSVGITDIAPIGAAVSPEGRLCVIHARDEDDFDRAARQIRAAMRIESKTAGAAADREREDLPERLMVEAVRPKEVDALVRIRHRRSTWRKRISR
jgi:thymidine phosphorylase